MPTWLKQKLKRAYLQKDRYQILILNQCWFHYKQKNSNIKTLNHK
ncbi:cortex morphogenetic protein CmpA [Halalkalibacter nanhaiisediminis]|uniref:Cortex morphogenetic protein CmpA n=1 Tax=Halalkalibacter nanhaiisediminis TaxID=688079 RepID=A0A562QB97_9BACI|nr:cortex morphogenetic protein CmpA [Halalkalibacter nanhaiisediminis]TWI54027.1 hypothetical protein IQ10_03128 [Halalkalibacter nanhaiisediminis]